MTAPQPLDLFDTATQTPTNAEEEAATVGATAPAPDISNLSDAGARSEPAIELRVLGRPAPQGSKRHVGRGIMIESSKHVRPWRDAVRSDAIAYGLLDTLDGPLEVSMVFTLPKPQSAPKRRRTWPDRTPDLSKLARSTEDALTDAGIWADDARVVAYTRLAKVYPGEDIDALDTPGVLIRIWAVTA